MSEPSAATRRVIDQARAVLDDVLDDARAWLLAASGDVSVEAKDDGTPVSNADLELDERLSNHLTDHFPKHGIISEERNTVAPDATWTWIIDPIDGTSNFICRLPYWCVSVALAYEGRPVLGVVDAPVLGRRYQAAHGGGAFVQSRTTSLNGQTQQHWRRQMHVRDTVDWRDGRNRHVPVMLTTGTARSARAAGLRLNPRVMGSTALDLAMVAEGAAVASIARIPKIWDIAAGVVLVEEAGGAISHLDEPSMFPMEAGIEHVRRSTVTAAGPDPDFADGLARALLASR